MTPYYEDDAVTLYHGDCREVTAWLEADVLVTDPPYGIGWSRPLLPSTKGKQQGHAGISNDLDVTVRDAALGLWPSDRPALVFGSLRAEWPAGWRRMLVFQKPLNAGLFGQRVPWLANWEPIFMLGKWPDQTPTRSAVVSTRRLAASGYSGYVTESGHPHAKPLDVLEDLIDACPTGVIADPFAGSGSALVAAKHLGRAAIGVEIDEAYCEIAANRLGQDVLDFTGATP